MSGEEAQHLATSLAQIDQDPQSNYAIVEVSDQNYVVVVRRLGGAEFVLSKPGKVRHLQ